ncbi:MAG TPA: T9SS type A sorting domain-containing protein [Bacteroidia bacterium]|jgi:hypothetical protein|nr:T9SS type A sorting domain-containing protein [Bacteroidia bacterium]
MKTKLLLVLAALGLSLVKLAAQDLAPGINYSYNPPGANGIITGITIDVVNNDNNAASSFDVAMYLYDPNTTNYWVIGTTNIPSLSGNSLITISNWDIDINNTPGIAAGTYRLGIWTDSNNDISETDENNNTGLLAGNINYTPSASGVNDHSLLLSAISLFPVPANDHVSVSIDLNSSSDVKVKIYDVTGKLLLSQNNGTLMQGQQTMEVETSQLPNGTYIIQVIAGESVASKRLVIAH